MSKKQSAEEGNRLFPVFLKIDQLNILIIGGGNVGLEKLQGLLKNDAGARVRLIAKSIKQEIKQLAAAHPSVHLLERAFEAQDLEGTEVLILATELRSTNAEIRKLAKEKNILTNVADTPDLCDFYLGSTVKKGDLKIGISTNGKSPTFAKRFRELLEDALPDDINDLLNNLHEVRNRLKGDFQYKVKKLNEITANLLASSFESTNNEDK
jgi:siroheme synthase-like protein